MWSGLDRVAYEFTTYPRETWPGNPCKRFEKLRSSHI